MDKLTPDELHESEAAVTRLILEVYKMDNFELARRVDRYILWLRKELAVAHDRLSRTGH